MGGGIVEYIRKKYVGVDLSNGRLKALELNGGTFIDKKIEEIIPEALNDKGYDNYWHDYNELKQLLTYVLKSIKSLSRLVLFISCPFENSRKEDRRVVLKAALKSGWGNINVIGDYLCAAVGSGMDVDENKRKLYLYSLNNTTYMGLIFAGSAFNVKCLKKGFDELTEEDLRDSIGEILNEVSPKLPEEFSKMIVHKNQLEEVAEGWNLNIEKKVYLSVPYESRDKFDHNLGEYEPVYLNYEDCALEGLRKIITSFKGKK